MADPSTPPTRPDTHTIEYTIDLTTFDQAKLDFIKSRIVDELTALLNAPQPQLKAQFSRQHHDRVRVG